MQAAQQECPTKPTMPSTAVRSLRYHLILEELGELDVAFMNAEINDATDAIADLLVVVLGTAVACGIDIAPVFDEVHRSNMTKFIDGHRREDGKWIKGPSYSPANIAKILANQDNSNL